MVTMSLCQTKFRVYQKFGEAHDVFIYANFENRPYNTVLSSRKLGQIPSLLILLCCRYFGWCLAVAFEIIYFQSAAIWVLFHQYYCFCTQVCRNQVDLVNKALLTADCSQVHSAKPLLWDTSYLILKAPKTNLSIKLSKFPYKS